jgi:hypothetical protein
MVMVMSAAQAPEQSEQQTGRSSETPSTGPWVGKPWQRGLIVDAMRARQEAELAGGTAQRYTGFADHPLFRVSRVAVKDGKALPVLAVVGHVPH